NDPLHVVIKHPQKEVIDSVAYIFDDKTVAHTQGNAETELNLQGPLGKQPLTAMVYANGKEYEISRNITLYTDKKAKVYTYKIVNSYPHDTKAFTQGLEFYND